MIMTNESCKKLWDEIFGTAWTAITSAVTDIGAFLVEGENFLIDSNARRILGLDADATGTQLIETLQAYFSDVTTISPLRIRPVEAPEGVKAGVVYIESENTRIKPSGLLPSVSQNELIDIINDNIGSILLALINIDGVENRYRGDVRVSSVIYQALGEYKDKTGISVYSGNKYWIYIKDFHGDADKFAREFKDTVRSGIAAMHIDGSSFQRQSVTVTMGYGVGFEKASMFMHAAGCALYEAQAKGAGSYCIFTPEKYEHQKNEFVNIRAFSELLDDNLFTYHFQPIVSASTGDILAYEALMRTPQEIGLNPFQILDYAERYGRLYDIERATISNTMKYLSEHQSEFEGRSLYVNSITAHMLKDDDFAAITADYGELMEKVVIELTEQTEITDESLERIHRRMKDNHMHLAIDDYGTGYSNTSNLLRYDPDIVKIDRSLITNIDSNLKMQQIVSGIIDFLHASGYLALAEGVETREELHTMIAFGADYIQGYYVSRPKPVLLREISSNIKNEIVKFSQETGNGTRKIYHVSENEIVDLAKLVSKNYTHIFIAVSNAVIDGFGLEKPAAVSIIVKDGKKSTIVIKSVNLIASNSEPLVQIGNNSEVEFICTGNNCFEHRGIYVPSSSSLLIKGSGDLKILAEARSCYAIGNDCQHSAGNITVEMTGELEVCANGDECVAIGGGKNSKNTKIRIISGAVSVACTGDVCLGVGCFNEHADIELSDCSLNFKMSAVHSVGIGSVNGSADVSLKNYSIEANLAGNMQTGIGVESEGKGSVDICAGRMNMVLRGRNLACIGTRGGDMKIDADGSIFRLYCEGGITSGIGDAEGSGDVAIRNSELNITFHTDNGFGAGSKNGSLIYDGGVQYISINE